MFCLAEKNFPDKLAENDVSSMPSNLRERAKEILGEDLVSMPTAAEIQFIVPMNEYDKVCKEVMHISKTKAKEVAHTQSPLITGTQHSNDNQIIAEKSTSDAPINENLASCASQIEDFRRCSLLASNSKKNTDLLELTKTISIMNGFAMLRFEFIIDNQCHTLAFESWVVMISAQVYPTFCTKVEYGWIDSSN